MSLPASLARLRRQNADPRTRRDRALALRLRRVFEGELAEADVRGLDFYVRDGHVIVRGAVRHALDEQLIVALIESFEGVKSVEAHLRPLDLKPIEGSEGP